MRAFVLLARKARTTPDFELNDLPGSGGRLDLVARCVTQALWLSHKLREDTCFYAVLCGPRNPPKSIAFFAPSLRRVSPDERNIGSWIKKALEKSEKEKSKDWLFVQPGIAIAKIGLIKLLEELKSDFTFYVLHEKGEKIESVEFASNPCFILGDHLGIPKKIENHVVKKFKAKKVSLGKQSYLASSCIAIVHHELDKRK